MHDGILWGDRKKEEEEENRQGGGRTDGRAEGERVGRMCSQKENESWNEEAGLKVRYLEEGKKD